MSFVARMRRNERGALRELLEAHGAAVERLALGLGAAEALVRVAVRLWKASTVVGELADERGWALVQTAMAVAPAADDASPFAERDNARLYELAAKRAVGLGDVLDAKLLHDMTRDPASRAAADQVAAAVREALRAGPGPGAYAELWGEIEPRL